jgi:hypothetical protein
MKETSPVAGRVSQMTKMYEAQNERNTTSSELHAEPGLYEIRLKGLLDDGWAAWFGGLTITREDAGDTLLTGAVVDQAALHGLLRKVRDLGAPLLSVRRVEPGTIPIVQKGENMNSPKRLARIAGVLYLLVGICGGFAEGFVDPKMYAAGNAAVTAGNVVANSGLVRLGVVGHLLDGTFFVFLAMLLYVLLQHVHKSVARAMLVLVALATGIICLNAIFQFEALRVATDSAYAGALGAAGSSAVVLLLLDIQHFGTLSAQVFFGLWLVPLGYLAYKSSGMFPKWLGIVLITGGVCYLVDLLAAFLVPDFGQQIHGLVIIPSAIAEISMVLYLLVVGVKSVSAIHELIPSVPRMEN